MANEVLDASSIDVMDDYELTGEYEDDDQGQPDNNPHNDTDNPNPNDNKNEPDNQPDFTTEVLKRKGIFDPTKIKFEDEETGAIIERDWKELTKEEQLNILTQEGDPETDLDDDEIAFINQIRESGLSIEDFIKSIQNSAVQQVQQSQPVQHKVNELEDDELFILDLIEKVGEENITDEELQEELNRAKENETLFAKRIQALRVHYKALEDENNLRQEEDIRRQNEENYQNFSNSILNEIQGLDKLGDEDIELSFEEMNDLANFILTKDEAGYTEFGKQLNNPKTFTTIAFWALKGPEIIAQMQDELKNAYQRGYNDGKNPKSNETKLVILPRTSPNKKADSDRADYAFGDDDSYLYN